MEKKLRNEIIEKLKKEIEELKTKNIKPKLVVVQIGEDQASTIYIKNKQITCAKIGIDSQKILLNENISFEKLKITIDKLNQDQTVTGILVQFPLPKHLDENKVVSLINPNKDVDALNFENQGKNIFKTNEQVPKPCTPSGIIKLLKEYKINLEGKHIVVIGRSKIVGMPLTFLLTQENATISHINSKTTKETLKHLLKKADIVISATGKPDLFTKEDVQKGVVLVDVGIIRSKGKLRGDIDFEEFKNIASYITPVPGGIGPMTVAMLMANVVLLAKKNDKKSS